MNEHDIPVLQPPAEITAETLPLLQRVTDAYDRGEAPGLVLDLSAVRTITSAGLAHLVVVGRRLGEHGAPLALACGTRPVVRLLRTVGLDQVMPHFRTVREATAWVRTRSKPSP